LNVTVISGFVPYRTLYKALEPMELRPQIRAYLCSAIYAALIIVHLHGSRLLVTALLQLAICVSLLVLLLLLFSYRNEIRDLVLDAFRACANLLWCLLPALQPDWLPPTSPVFRSDPFRSILFQRPPPRIA
jgi:hypothetical protein